MAMYVLGISAFYHDSAAALVKDGVPVAAAQEERFTRVRHDPAFPAQAIAYCLDAEGITLDELEAVVYYEDPQEKFSRVMSSFASGGIGGARTFINAMPEWIRWKWNVLKFVDEQLEALGRGKAPRTQASRHHRSHAAAAFYPSPFENAAVLCIDGIGEWHSTTIWQGQGSSLELKNSISYPHSLGLLYSAMTYYCGFKVDSGEYKLMGLAPYGQPIYADKIRDELINIRPDGSFTLNMKYFEYLRGERMVGEAFEALFDGPIRQPESPISQRECDLAASIQKVTEEVVLGLATAAVKQTGQRNLCLAGGVALNCVANGVLSRSGRFDSIWIQPAAGDAGCALGAAMDYAVKRCGRPHLASSKSDAMSGSLLGPGFDDEEIAAFLLENQYPFIRYDDNGLYDQVASRLADGAVVGWFQGRMEFGPRALGARSILGDARNPQMQRTMNLKIKYRESFRPFAPAVLAEDAGSYFDICEKPLHADGRTGVGRHQNPAIVARGRPGAWLGQHQQCSLAIAGSDPCRPVGAGANGDRGKQRPVHLLVAQFQATHRLFGTGQYLVQRARRAHRVQARGGVCLLYAHGNGRSGTGPLRTGAAGPACLC